jgi:hypothetical protein
MSTQIGLTHRGEGTAVREVEGGSTTEALGGAAAIVLAILGLVGILPNVLGSIAIIAVGAALLIAGGAIAASFTRAVEANAAPGMTRHSVVRGMGGEAMTGVAGIVLGILALIGVATPVLMSISAIVLGAGLLMASGAMARLESLTRVESTAAGSVTHDTVYAATGTEVLVGVGAIVLGILGLAHHDPVTLSLVAMLAIGASVLLSGSALAARFFGLFH